MPGDLQRAGAGVGVLDKTRNIVRDITDDRAGEGDHTDEHRNHADDDQAHTGLSDVRDHILDAAGIQYHADRVKDR